MLFDLPPRLRHSRQNRQLFFNERVDRPCPACGHVVAFEPRAIGVVCGHCRSPLHRQPDDDTPLAPTGTLSFRLSEDDARAKIIEAEGQPAPGAVSAGQVQALRRLYVPYWRFSAHVVASWNVSKYDHVDDDYERKHGGFASDYDEATPAAMLDGDVEALAAFKPTHLAEASPYDVSQFGEITVLPPTRPLADAWSDMRERWEARIQKVMHRDRGESVFAPSEITDSSSEFSQERGALVYVPVYVADREAGASDTSPIVVDAYSGEVVRAKTRRTQDEAGVDLASVQVPEAAIGVGVLIVVGLVILAVALWVLRHLYWY